MVRSPHLKVLGIPREGGGGGGSSKTPGTEIFGGRERKSKSLPWGGGGGYLFSNRTLHVHCSASLFQSYACNYFLLGI